MISILYLVAWLVTFHHKKYIQNDCPSIWLSSILTFTPITALSDKYNYTKPYISRSLVSEYRVH